MSGTYSTLHRDVRAGRIFSSRQGVVTVLVGEEPAPGVGRGAGVAPQGSRAVLAVQAPVQAPVPIAAPVKRYLLSAQGLPAATLAGPGALGEVLVHPLTGESYLITAGLVGMNQLPDPALAPVLWLVHDLSVPADLGGADLAALPKGPDGTGNRPGATFTLDGRPPVFGPNGNTVSLPVSPGAFTRRADGTWQLAGRLDPSTNRTFHPVAMLGPGVLREGNASLPSGRALRLLTDLFLRPATVHPELAPQKGILNRMAAVAARSVLDCEESYLPLAAFRRAIITLEGPVRTIPRLMPTREAIALSGPEAVLAQ